MKIESELDKIVKIILKVSILMFSMSLVTKSLGYLFHMMLTKSLSIELYGVFTLTWIIITSSSCILLLGIPEAVGRYIAFYRGKGEEENVGTTIITGFLLILPLIIISLILLFILFFKLFPSFLPLKGKFFIFSLLFVAFSSFIFLNNILSGFRKPQIATFADILIQTLKIVFIFSLIMIGINLDRVLISLFLAITISTILAIIYVKRNFRISGCFKIGLARKLIKFGIPITLTVTTWELFSWVDKFITTFFLGFEKLGIYNVANLTASMGLMFVYPIIEIFRPIITEFFGKEDTKQINTLSSYLFESFFLLFIPIFLPIVIFAREILTILFTGEYSTGVVVLQILLFSTFLLSTSRIFTTILYASNNPHRVAIIVVIASTINIILNLILIKPFGINGVAISTLFSSLVLTTVSYLCVNKIITIKISFFRLTKIFFCGICALLIILPIKKIIYNSILSAFICGILNIIIYFVFLLIFKVIREMDVVILSAIMTKMNIPDKVKNLIIGVFSNHTSLGYSD